MFNILTVSFNACYTGESEYGFAMACLGLGLTYKLSCIITGKLLKVSDNAFDQFVGVWIISIVQQHFKVTITNQFDSKILSLIQFLSKVLVTVDENKRKQMPR